MHFIDRISRSRTDRSGFFWKLVDLRSFWRWTRMHQRKIQTRAIFSKKKPSLLIRVKKKRGARSAAGLPFKKKLIVVPSREEKTLFSTLFYFAGSETAPRPLDGRVLFSAWKNATLPSFRKIRRDTAEIRPDPTWPHIASYMSSYRTLYELI